MSPRIDLTQEAINAARKWFADNALAMPDHLHRGEPLATSERAVERYRAYYNECKQGFWRQPSSKWVPATWNKREVPEWFVRALEPSRPPTD